MYKMKTITKLTQNGLVIAVDLGLSSFLHSFCLSLLPSGSMVKKKKMAFQVGEMCLKLFPISVIINTCIVAIFKALP